MVFPLETYSDTFWTFQIINSDGKYCEAGILMQLVVYVWSSNDFIIYCVTS